MVESNYFERDAIVSIQLCGERAQVFKRVITNSLIFDEAARDQVELIMWVV